MKKVYLSLLTSCFILVTSSLSAELDRVLDDVLTTNPLIKQKMSNYEQTVYDLKIAKSEYLPKLDYIGRLGYEKTLEQVGGANDDRGFNTYRNSLVLTQNLFNGLKTVNRVNYEEARVMAAAYNYVEQTNDVAFNVIRQYINVLKFKDLYNLEKENVGLTRAILEKTQSLSDAGSGSISDVEKVGASLQLAEFNLLTQENNLMDSQFNLARLTGKRIDKDELILPKFTFDLPKTKDEAVSHAIKFNPSIIVANHNIETAKAQLAQNKGKFAPTIDFELAYNLDKNTGGDEGHERNYSALIVYRQNLYNGQADYNSVKKSKVAINQEYEIQGDIKRQIIEGLELSWSAYTMLQKQIVFLTSYQEQSRITLELYKEEFETGTRSLIDLLTAEDDYISARNKLITANYDLLFAKYRVLDAMGELVNSIYKDSSLNYYKPVFANYENVTDGKVIDRTDLDKDGVKDQQDLCDNTSLGIKVDMFGCEKEQINSDKNENSDLKLENNTSFKTITPYLENITNKPS
ncbi:TolC family outer membrane protein [Aliarcobacter cibarius]|uniref:TolC family outer membrane protein n=1 Tax=Aliarcobacter cibarius TaxID=255507 RepID=UPI000466816B|nr:TolC family outer membrane protein [Aliarcobacter cibarius]